MESKFKVGDKIIVRGPIMELGSFRANYIGHRIEAIIEHIQTNPDPEIGFRFGETSYRAHPIQCRRLNKKPRRRVWVWIDTTKGPSFAIGHEPSSVETNRNSNGYFEFIEVKNKGSNHGKSQKSESKNEKETD